MYGGEALDAPVWGLVSRQERALMDDSGSEGQKYRKRAEKKNKKKAIEREHAHPPQVPLAVCEGGGGGACVHVHARVC